MHKKISNQKNLSSARPLKWIDSPYLIWVITLIAFILRIVLPIVEAKHLTRVFQPDSQSYIDIAIQLISSGKYPASGAFRTPVYPLFIAVIYWIGGQNPLLVIAAQVILGTLTTFLVYRLGMKLFSKPVALMGAFLFAISIESITSAAYILTETLFTLLFLAGMIAWLNGYKKNRYFWMILSAVIMGCAVLCRPVGLYYPFILVLGMMVDKKRILYRRISNAIIFLSVFLLSLTPWLIRNIKVVGSPTLSTVSNYNLLFYEAVPLEAYLQQRNETEVRAEYATLIKQELVNEGLTDSEGNRSKIEGSLARQIILTHPVQFLYVHLKNDVNGLLPDVTSLTEILGVTIGGKGTLSVLHLRGILAAIQNYFGEQTWLLFLLLPFILFLMLEYILSLLGIIVHLRRHDWLILFLLVVPIVYFLGLPGGASLPRFRVPAMPYICLLAGVGLSWSYDYYGNHVMKRINKIPKD